MYGKLGLMIIMTITVPNRIYASEPGVLPSVILETAVEQTKQLIEAGKLENAEFYSHTNTLIQARMGDLKPRDLSRGELFTYTTLLARLGRRDETGPIIQKLKEGDDLVAQKAFSKWIVWLIRKKKTNQAEQQLKTYRKRFSPTPEFREGLSDPIDYFMARYQKDGEVEKGIHLFFEEMKRVPGNVPYHIFYAASHHWQKFAQTGSLDQLVEVIHQKRKQLNTAYLEKKSAGNKDLQSYTRLIKSMDNALTLMTLPGSQAPEIEFTDFLNGTPLTIGDLKGKVVLLDFWGSWCPPCIQAFPGLAEIDAAYRHQGFEILGVTSFYGMSRPALKAFLKKHNVTWTNGITKEDAHQLNAYGVSGLPMYFILNKAGKIHWIQIGTSEDVLEEVRKIVEKLLAE